VPRMRTIDEAMKLLKAEDPECQLTKNALRQMVLAGEVPFVLIGKRKRLINYDALIAKLNNLQISIPTATGKIRSIPERYTG